MPIALSVKGGPLATALWQYKDAQYQWEREAATRRLGDLAQTYLDRHETCLAESVAAVAFDIVTWVPSTASRPGTHPLADLLYSLPWAAGRVADGFAPAGGAVRGKAHHADADRFVAKPALRGKHVLIVDDTWTRGANALSAASAARKAGARTVAVAVIGRHFDEHYRDSTRDYVKAAKTLGFDFATCIYCDEQNPPAPAASRATAGTDENRRHTGEPRRTQLPPAASARPITGSGYSWESLPKLPKR